MIRAGLFLAAALAVASAAFAEPAFKPGDLSVGRYKGGQYWGVVTTHGRTVRIGVDGKRDGMILLPSQGELNRAIFGGGPGQWPMDYWREGVEAFLEPVGCGVPDVGLLKGLPSAMAIRWASFECPPDVDLRKLMREQHDALMRGEPLHR
jgi:hypothetical protein